MYHYLGSHRLAEKTLRDAAKINPHSPETWYVLRCKFNVIRPKCKSDLHSITFCRYNLGKVLESLGETNSATDSMATALQVEMVSPVMQYTSIPLPFD